MTLIEIEIETEAETGTLGLGAKCIRLPAVGVKNNVRCLFGPPDPNRFIVVNVLKKMGDLLRENSRGTITEETALTIGMTIEADFKYLHRIKNSSPRSIRSLIGY